MRLYAGADAATVQRRPCLLTGPRCFSAAVRTRSRFPPALVPHVRGLLDSGAFSDPPGARLTPAGALARQLDWERDASRLWGAPWRAEALVSYDLLIDEVWVDGRRRKRRWTAPEAERAVRATVEAASFLASRRRELAPRTLVLACQGVEAAQYGACARAVLAHARPGDVLGLGGWCVLGRWRSWLPEFWRTLWAVLPPASGAGLKGVHVFGVLWPTALGGLLWLADRHGLAASTDSSAPVLAASWPDARKAGALAPTWEANVRLWRRRLARLRRSPHYREPPGPARQLVFWQGVTP